MKNWKFESHYNGQRIGVHKESDECLELHFYEYDDARYIKTFELIPNQFYTAKVFVSGANISAQGKCGANICLYGTWSHSQEFNFGKGTFQGDLSVTFRAPENGIVTIGLRLGFWCSEAKGSVIFSNFYLNPNEDWVEMGEGTVRLNTSIDVLSLLPIDSVLLWIDHQIIAYEQMKRLYGKPPFEGQIVRYETRKNIDCYAFAGNPVVWNLDCMIGFFVDRMDAPQDACFGTIHEMGHNFDMTILTHINCELMANFALCYAVENASLPIHFDNAYTVGRGLQDGFYQKCYQNSIAKGKYHHDGFLYCLLLIKDKIGWKPFEITMRNLLKQNLHINNPSKIVEHWFDMLSSVSNTDVKTLIPPKDVQLILSQEKY